MEKTTSYKQVDKDKTIGVIVSPKLYGKIREGAAKESRSVSQFVRLVLERTLNGGK